MCTYPEFLGAQCFEKSAQHHNNIVLNQINAEARCILCWLESDFFMCVVLLDWMFISLFPHWAFLYLHFSPTRFDNVSRSALFLEGFFSFLQDVALLVSLSLIAHADQASDFCPLSFSRRYSFVFPLSVRAQVSGLLQHCFVLLCAAVSSVVWLASFCSVHQAQAFFQRLYFVYDESFLYFLTDLLLFRALVPSLLQRLCFVFDAIFWRTFCSVH